MIRSYHLFHLYTGKRVHLGVCGSIAAYKTLDLLRHLGKAGIDLGVTLTRAGQTFVPALNYQALGADPVFAPDNINAEDTFAHLTPGKTSDCMLVAPATANTLAQIAQGLAADLLSCQILSFPGPILIAPAMNPVMWEANATRHNWEVLKRRGFIPVTPGSGNTACGDRGQGRLAEGHIIFLNVLRSLSPQDLSGRKILITCGPTKEKFDAVRLWTNPSTGKMGFALATSAWLRGAQVWVVHGTETFPELPPDIKCIPAREAQTMHDAAIDLWPDMDIGCFAAAVADYTPSNPLCHKSKKAGQNELTIKFSRTPDILAKAGKNKKNGQLLIGFAAETDDLKAACRAKLKQKNLDLIAGNLIGKMDSGFASDKNTVTLLDRRDRIESWPPLDKTEVAWRIWDWLLDLK
ncbi:MAG: bifunctional phosphopantothenoylcysteine decarboxylase/phosphopantothenate--cysteine ligase CoaBC [Thermodesulfobacteriota bacterium]